MIGLGNRPNPLNWGRADWVDVGMVVGTLGLLMGLHHGLIWTVARSRIRDLRRQRAEVLRWRAAHALARESRPEPAPAI